jgi:cysteinyl-tRNA synthetase
MPLQVYNTLTKRKEIFQPLEPGRVRMYNCGPTVYSRVHIGNLRSFVFADLLRRWLEHEGYEVHQVMNVTDVGHLVDDADEGEDKMEVQARKEGRDPWKISRENTRQFLEDLERLNFKAAESYPRATDHIPEMLEIVDALVEKGYAYRAGENVYFEVSKFESYGRLSGNRVADLDAGARVDVLDEKRSPADFALWKSDPQHVMKWDSHYGPHGFPGWHIECSAMARKHLGDRIDIHTGGEDNVFPHHECEIAQTEAFTGAPFATYWMHAKFLQVDGGKMSKSLGNVYNLDDIVERGFEPRALRYTLLRGHYRQPLNFTWDILADSAKALEKLDDLVLRLRRIAAGDEGAADPAAGAAQLEALRSEFEDAMNDDLNTPRALAALFSLRDHAVQERLGREAALEALHFLEEVEGALGVLQLEREGLGSGIEAKIEERNEARRAKDWARSDAIRDELLALGILLEDKDGKTVWRRK